MTFVEQPMVFHMDGILPDDNDPVDDYNPLLLLLNLEAFGNNNGRNNLLPPPLIRQQQGNAPQGNAPQGNAPQGNIHVRRNLLPAFNATLE